MAFRENEVFFCTNLSIGDTTNNEYDDIFLHHFVFNILRFFRVGNIEMIQ